VNKSPQTGHATMVTKWRVIIGGDWKLEASYLEGQKKVHGGKRIGERSSVILWGLLTKRQGKPFPEIKRGLDLDVDVANRTGSEKGVVVTTDRPASSKNDRRED